MQPAKLAALAITLWAFPLLPAVEETPRYDPATVVDLDAVVADLRVDSDLYLTVRTDNDDSYVVYVAPMDFLQSIGVHFQKGDRIRVEGSKVKRAEGWLVLARELRWGGSTLALRDSLGRPYWKELFKQKS